MVGGGKLVDAEHSGCNSISCGCLGELELQTHCKLAEDSWIQFCESQVWLSIIRNKEPFGGDNV